MLSTFEIDGELLEVRRDGLRLQLEPKVFDVLTYLARHADRFVSRGELTRAVWGEVKVEPDSLTRCIYCIRKALGSRACIETRYRKGYRLVFDAPGRR